MVKKRTFLIAGAVVFLFLGGLLLNVHQITHTPHFNDLDSGSLKDTLFAIPLAGLVLFLASGVGKHLIKPFKLENFTFIERFVIGTPLGLAIIAYVVFFMGLAGWIKTIHFIILLIIISILSFKQSCSFIEEAFRNLWGFRATWKDFSLLKKMVFSAGALALALAMFQAFTPPWDYDGLAYHLQGPRLFLDAGKIIPITENWFTFYPFTWEMLYMLGIGLGSDIFARLIHFTTLILFLLATYAFGRRFLPLPGGWVAAAILLGIPILLLWGNAAYTDIAWALFQFLAIGIFLVWLKDQNPKLLIVSGVMQGLALGSKYLAFYGAGILLVFVIWFSYRGDSDWPGWKKFSYNVLAFGLAAFVTALPWYLKNLVWTGNPLFPLYFHQDLIDPVQLSIWMDYVNSFGTGKNWYDYLLLPINIYLQHEKFGTFMGSMEMASPIFLFVFAYPWLRRSMESEFRKTLDVLALISGVQFIAWAFGSQQTRFLLPIFPGFSILASGVLLVLSVRLKKNNLGKSIQSGLTFGMILVTLIFMGIYMGLTQPGRVLFGLESKQEFLDRILRDYPGIRYVNETLPETAKVMFLWDGRGYYCDKKCLPDVDQSRWVAMVKNSSSIKVITDKLDVNGITHIFLSKEDISYFLIMHYQMGEYLEDSTKLLHDIAPVCADEVFTDDWVQILKLDLNMEVCR